MQNGAGLALLAERISETVTRASTHGGAAEQYGTELHNRFSRIVEVTAAVWGTGDAAVALANSTAYLEAMGHTVIAWMWLEQLLAVGDRIGDFYDGKRSAARYFFVYELPKVDAQLDLLALLDRTTLDMSPAWF
jgi:butyryl-CoA dehydrogenase